MWQAAEVRHEEQSQRGASERRELELKVEEMEEKEQVLQARIEALQADNDFTNERLAALQGTTHSRLAGVSIRTRLKHSQLLYIPPSF